MTSPDGWFMPVFPVNPDRASAIEEAKQLKRCQLESFAGAKWRDEQGEWQYLTWEELGQLSRPFRLGGNNG